MIKPIIAANWKMNGSSVMVSTVVGEITRNSGNVDGLEVVIFPPYVYLPQMQQLLEGSNIKLGAQNVYYGANGAFTGEISASMLAEFGCDYVIIGHSERRLILQEDNQLIAKKCKSALEAGLKPIICVGETQEERQNHATLDVITRQIQTLFEEVSIKSFSNIVIAYEPVWAIGTGASASPNRVHEVLLHIRSLLAEQSGEIAKKLPILYGGSVKPDNTAEFMQQQDINGLLVGGASLKAKDFLKIIEVVKKT